ncbi:MAG: helicase-related protein [Candidatus Azambacteria bacterium]|nr:helicase-related protein [Candidatus Azambacteria bacterium]
MKHHNKILIAAFIPIFAERDVLWFEENDEKIKRLIATDAFWARRATILEEGMRISMSEFLRSLDELEYEKTQRIAGEGEFSVIGGAVTIFPLNIDHPVRIEFLGNSIETIAHLKKEETAGERKAHLLKKEMLKREISHLHNLKEGDYLVHIDHGIGIFRGIKERVIEGEEKKYYVLEYAPPHAPCLSKSEGIGIQTAVQRSDSVVVRRPEHDTLYVPEDKVKKLSLYIGLEQPTIHRLSGTTWEHAKRKVTEDAQILGKELLELYAKRTQATREPYPAHGVDQREFDSIFEHLETIDQQKAIEEVFADMERDQPMDRLICGDVGFGKTEVALRAAFKAVHAGRQVALLCPTTVLADQHFETFTKRFEKFPIAIGMLSRFESKTAQRETLAKLTKGTVDIVIGTHRVLSPDVQFKNIGLVIIDEEQRFGVRQKETFKKLRESIDVLSLSATPIPRTLYLSLSGLRSISVINTPPPSRQPIETFVLPYDKAMVKKALTDELARKGQIYFLHNKIETLEAVKRSLEELVPQARYGTAHGRTSELALRKTMHDFKAGKFDVLVATTIIENGLDLKNANTLIVEDAGRLGLAQAYQIRGRIGRSDKKAYAYFFYSAQKLGDMARKRLEALEEARELGSGYFIAQRDLEIRGAGNILGKKQSGAVNQVGLNLYCQILNEAIERLQTTKESN